MTDTHNRELHPTDDHVTEVSLNTWLIAAGVTLVSFGYAYWPTLGDLVHTWETQPDYSHGYLVVPMAAIMLWFRRESLPEFTGRLHWAGLSLLLLSVLLRVAGAVFFLSPVDGWSMVFWAAGAVWFLFGPQILWWSLPGIAFLFFMVPLPFRVEKWLSVPLQKIATVMSCWTLQLLGQPAIAEGNVIHMGEHEMFVAEACSGLRIFMGIMALAFVYIVMVRRTWWERLILIGSILPIALVANVTRIVVTAFLYEYASTDAGRKFSHDWAGFVMIPYAAALFGLVLWYLSVLFHEVEKLDVRAALRQARG
jgi:exosortase